MPRGMTADAGDMQRVAVIADDVVSVRSMNPTEMFALQALRKAGVPSAIAAAAFMAVAPLLTFATLYHTPNWYVLVVALSIMVVRLFPWVVGTLRRALWLGRDLRLGKILVLESARGRIERLGASGLLWRTGEGPAPWRSQ